MSNWAGSFKFLGILLLILQFSSQVFAADDEFHFDTTRWERFAHEVEVQKTIDERNGLSYIISGSLALVGGIVGGNVSQDVSEKGIYAVFQTIGIASIGYGAYTWEIGGEERSIYQTLQYTKFTPEQRSQFLRAYLRQRKERERQDRYIRAVTHGLIAALNVYDGLQQKPGGLRNTFYFVGGVNLLAAISFSIEF